MNQTEDVCLTQKKKKKTPYCYPKCLQTLLPFYITPTTCKSSCSSTSLWELGMVWLLNFSHLIMSVITSHCALIWISLWLIMLSVFSCALFLSSYLLQGRIYSNLWCIFLVHLFVSSLSCEITMWFHGHIICITQWTNSVQLLTLTLCNPLDCSMPGFPVHHQLPIPKTYSNSCPLSQWCHPTTSSSVVPFSSCLQSSQHQSLCSSHQVAKVLELQHQSF